MSVPRIHFLTIIRRNIFHQDIFALSLYTTGTKHIGCKQCIKNLHSVNQITEVPNIPQLCAVRGLAEGKQFSTSTHISIYWRILNANVPANISNSYPWVWKLSNY